MEEFMKGNCSLLLILLGCATVHADILSNLSPFFSSSRPDYDPVSLQGDGTAMDLRQAPFSPADSDLGMQQILQPYAGLPPVEFRFNSSYHHTDNIPDINPFRDESAWFWASELDVNWMPRLAKGWFLDTGLNQAWYRFDDNRAVNFENFEAHVGLVKSITQLDNLLVFARYENQRLTNGEYSDSSYSAQRIRVGLQKDLILAPRYQLSAGIDAAFDLVAHQDRLKRDQYTADLSFTYWFADRLSTTLSWTASQWDFDVAGREDINQIVGWEIAWTPAESVSIFANVYYTHNDSNALFGINDYQSLQTGIGFGLNYSF
jgi:hypothetical protein